MIYGNDKYFYDKIFILLPSFIIVKKYLYLNQEKNVSYKQKVV